MPDIAFSDENKTVSVFDQDQLRLDKGERARICILDQQPKMHLVHYIRTGTGDEARGRYYCCLGDYKTVMENGKDPGNCPACAVAEGGREVAVPLARRRFVINVCRYRTNQAGTLLKPLSMALQVWLFADDKFNKLTERAKEHGDLRKKDILLTCVAKQYQNYDMDISSKNPAWASEPGGREQLKELLSHRNPDIERLVGTPMTYEALEKLVGEATPEIAEKDLANLVNGTNPSPLENLRELGEEAIGSTDLTSLDGDPIIDGALAAPEGEEQVVDFMKFLNAED